jgi:type II secretory pathway component PulC
MIRILIALISMATNLSCGGGGAGAHAEPRPPAQAPAAEQTAAAEAAPEVTPTRPEGTIARADLDAVLAGGLGRFLQGVETEPFREGGRFVGFRVLSFYPDDPALSSVDLSSGDVVVRVNGQSIERPEHAIRVWDSLRVASELVVDVLRDGEPRELRFAIVD